MALFDTLGAQLPDFRLATLGGTSVSLSDFLGKKTLYFLWSSWDPSREHLGPLQSFQNSSPAQKIQVVGITTEIQGAELPSRYLRAAGASFQNLIDGCFLLSRVWGVHSVPHLVLADENGCVSLRGDIPTAETLRAVRSGLDEPPRSQPVQATRSDSSPEVVEILVQNAGNAMGRGSRDDALEFLRQALVKDPRNDLIRRQIWAIKYPDRFYQGEIDREWLETMLAATRRLPPR